MLHLDRGQGADDYASSRPLTAVAFAIPIGVLVLVETANLEKSNEDLACAAAVRAVEREVETWRRGRARAVGR